MSDRAEHGGPVQADDPSGRRRLDVVFGLLLASGAIVVAVCLLAIGNWVKPQGEAAFGIYLLGMFSFAPAVLAWLASGLQVFIAPRDRDARLGAALATGHLGWWLFVLALAKWLDESLPGWVMSIILVEPAVYGVGATCLAVRWFGWRRPHSPGQVAA